jgi:CheY-like chemotaxis protein
MVFTVNAAQTKTVLCVEDNSINLQLLQAILQARANVQILTATQGQVGLEKARQQQPHLTLLDLHLPDMNGEEYLRHLRADAATANLPVVVMSADPLDEHTLPWAELGVADYLTKPFDLDDFDRIVDRYLGPRKDS